MQYKELWDLESAMQVLTHDEADSRLWAEAVEWLIINGPPEIRRLLLEASSAAIEGAFPHLKPSSLGPDGQLLYNVDELANSLGVSSEEAKRILKEKEALLPLAGLVEESGSGKVH